MNESQSHRNEKSNKNFNCYWKYSSAKRERERWGSTESMKEFSLCCSHFPYARCCSKSWGIFHKSLLMHPLRQIVTNENSSNSDVIAACPALSTVCSTDRFHWSDLNSTRICKKCLCFIIDKIKVPLHRHFERRWTMKCAGNVVMTHPAQCKINKQTHTRRSIERRNINEKRAMHQWIKEETWAKRARERHNCVCI